MIPAAPATGGYNLHLRATSHTTFEFTTAMKYTIKFDSVLSISQLANNSLLDNLQYFTAPLDFANIRNDAINLFQQMQKYVHFGSEIDLHCIVHGRLSFISTISAEIAFILSNSK